MSKLEYSILIADLLWIAFCCIAGGHAGIALSSANSHLGLPVTGPLIVLAALLWTVLFFAHELGGFWGAWSLPSVYARVLVAVTYLIGSSWLIARVSPYDFSTVALLWLAGLLPVGFVANRYLVWRFLCAFADIRPKRRVAILGGSRIARELAFKISRHPETSMEVAGILIPSDAGRVGPPPGLLGSVSLRTLNILDLMQKKKIHEVIIAEDGRPSPEIEKLIASCRKTGLRVHIVPQACDLFLSRTKLTDIEDVPLLTLEEQTQPSAGLRLKRVVDVLCAVLLMIPAAPVIAVAALGLLRKRQTAFRREVRAGQNGAPFYMWRFNVDRDAPGLGAFERCLVRFSLSELPQLWNVLRGEMSLVGPRPESPERVRHYSIWQRQRLSALPGLTGLAQVHGLREQHSSEVKARFDLQYIFHWSLFLDFSLLLQTTWTLFARVMGEGTPAAPRSSRRQFEFGFPGALNVNRTYSGAD